MLARRPCAQAVGWHAALALILACAIHSAAQAQDAADSYESQRLASFLASASLVPDAEPEGKTVAYVRVVRRQVLEGDELRVPLVLPELAPTWPNRFHWLSEDNMVRRELLLEDGDVFRASLAEESTRNLRDLGAFALVRIVAVRTGDPHRVGVVVYTRDLWSLRLEQSFAGAGTTFSLGLQLVERNFLGRNKQLATRFSLDRFTYSLGQTYLDPRIAGGELRLYESFDAIVNRASGKPEGSVGTLLIGRPFHNLAQRVSFDVLAHYSDLVARDLSDGRVVGVQVNAGLQHGTPCPPGASAGCVARVWDDRRIQLEAAASRRFGERYTQTFTLGAGFRDAAAAANPESLVPASLVAAFDRSVLPLVRREAYPYLRYRLDLPRYTVFTNLGTFGQSENVQTGPRLDGRINVPIQALGSSRDGMVARGLFGYVWAADDALFDAVAEGSARLDGSQVIDELGRLRLRAATPSFRGLGGRFVARGIWALRRHDTQNTLVALGGDNGLRGYASQHFYGLGASCLLGNLEYRTRPWVVSSVHLGLVAFYDAGSVYARFSQARLHHSAGAGLRALFPQFNRYVFRLDCGAPLDQPGFAVMLSYGTDQVVPLTAEEDALLPSALELN